MKNLILVFLAIFIFSAHASAQTSTSTALNTKVGVKTDVIKADVKADVKARVEGEEVITWNEKTHQFGKIPQGVPATAEFKITNNSNVEMVILDAKGSCGCTVPTYKKTPILPGESTVIKATYNAAKMGKFTKSVTVKTSLKTQPEILLIKGEVITK